VFLSVGVCEEGGVAPPPHESVNRAAVEGRRSWLQDTLKRNSLISRRIGDFSIYTARACLFSGKLC